MKISCCRSCGSTKLKLILDLGESAWCNLLVKKEKLDKIEKYPLRLFVCDECKLIQIDFTVPKEKMFSEHNYVSGTTTTLVQHFYEIAKENIVQFNLGFDDVIMDLGGNDGSHLLQYKKFKYNNVINVESAANIAEISRKNGVFTYNCFFNESFVDEYLENGGEKVKLFLSSGSFFHLEELHSVLRGIVKVLDRDGVFCVQFGDSTSVIKNRNIDYIYHEHLCLYSLLSLKNLLNRYGLDIFDAYKSDIHNGSIIAKVSFVESEKYQKTYRYEELYNEETAFYNNEVGLFSEFSDDVEKNRFRLKNLLIKLKGENKKIYGMGAPAKAVTLLSYEEVDNNIIDKLVEKNEMKVGLYNPNGIYIDAESDDDIPDYYLLLSHNFAKEIVKKKKNIILGGCSFIIPFPKIKIINKDNVDLFLESVL